MDEFLGQAATLVASPPGGVGANGTQSVQAVGGVVIRNDPRGACERLTLVERLRRVD